MPLTLIGFLVLFPLLAAGLLLVVRNDRGRDIIVVGSAGLIMVGVLVLAVSYLGCSWRGSVDRTLVTYFTIVVDLLVTAYILTMSIRYRKPLAGTLAVVQLALIQAFEFFVAHDAPITDDLYIDSLSVIMALVIGIIGGGICIYALGYMKDFQSHAGLGAGHADGAKGSAKGAAGDDSDADAQNAADTADEYAPDAKDRRPVFFALMFLFLSAMFGIVFSNNLGWLLCAWEVTTVCSFALIG
ncbi:MAG: hypothetical protein LBP24_05225, partial [Coriobacteriales bacterium]|nr:hypothetical protein [Coriobacteriales bacterium]